MDDRKARGDLPGDARTISRTLRGGRAASRRFALQEIHREKVGVVFLPGVEDGNEVFVAKSGGEAAHEALPGLGAPSRSGFMTLRATRERSDRSSARKR